MNYIQAFQKIIEEDPRYHIEAYLFVLEGLHYTRKKLKKEKHVTGQELLEGIKELALKYYGALAKTVFEHWGIKETIDFGNIVFNMVNNKILSKTKEDKLDDFKDVYDFNKVFIENYKFNGKWLKNIKK